MARAILLVRIPWRASCKTSCGMIFRNIREVCSTMDSFAERLLGMMSTPHQRFHMHQSCSSQHFFKKELWFLFFYYQMMLRMHLVRYLNCLYKKKDKKTAVNSVIWCLYYKFIKWILAQKCSQYIVIINVFKL